MEDKNVPVVEVKDLVVHYETYDGVVEAVNGVSFKIEKKDVLGLVGETGRRQNYHCAKSDAAATSSASSHYQRQHQIRRRGNCPSRRRN